MGRNKSHSNGAGTQKTNQPQQKTSKIGKHKREAHKEAVGAQSDKKYLILVSVIAVVFGFLHYNHTYGMFERQRYFSHLSTLERELSFRTEMGLYYSYYKTMAEAPTYISGLSQLVRCNITEYPDTVNVLRRFNLYPELVLGTFYRMYTWLGAVTETRLKKCYSITRGNGLSPVESCVGMGDIAHFYTMPIFWMSGLTVSFLFLAGSYASGSILGGALSVAAYFANHGECTRVMWTPPLRESFSFPFLMGQLLTVIHLLKCSKPDLKHSIVLSIITTLFMLPWQFAQFALLTQVCALFGLYILKFLDGGRLTVILNGLLISHTLNFIAQFANTLLISSFFLAATVAALVIVKLEKVFETLPHRIVTWVCQGGMFIFLSIALKIGTAKIFQLKDDAHIFDILKSKFTDYKDFHTLLYVCAPEFDFIGFEYFKKISMTALLPVSIVAAIVCLIQNKACVLMIVLLSVFEIKMIAINEWRYWIKGETDKTSNDEKEESSSSESATKPYLVHFYLILQCIAFMIMSVMLMRLKLFGTPSLCMLVCFIASKEVFGFLGKNNNIRYSIIFIVFGLMSIQGYKNMKQQLSMRGEYTNPNLENLVEWINANTNPNDVFAGAMPTMAAVKLSTERPIVNHPHYEDAGLRARTKRVYQLYSRKPKEYVHQQLKKMGVTYAILEDSWCTRRTRPGCGLPEVWDIEDPENVGNQPVCTILKNRPEPFTVLYRNEHYLVLQV